ncbi:FkbM family methyltransferase [Lysobacter sp. UC]|uniref:FkbM family methyltransferase n=1 Tax=Lysobacter arvi TaxID=3038776 RepID=A0ABU1CFD5_9GAMM|nr:FkbM family methyltransferase [Lysobacter arvi]MDR0183638.1 FkbM family methyltransferase [Lysobacter arvi]
MSTFVSYAQNFEDVILRRVLADVHGGFYVDVGAQHPLRDSVTRAFYERGWRGINIEPVSEWHGLLQVDRPEDLNLKLAIGAAPGNMAFYEVRGTGLSTADADIAARHRMEGFEVTLNAVEVSTLDAVLEQHAKPQIHFLKIDVEGGELGVLRGLSLSRYRPWVIVVEATLPNSQENASAAWEPILLENGYKRVYNDGLNHFYLADEHSELAARFAYPPNFFDNFVRHADWERAEDARRLAEENERLLLHIDDVEERHRVAMERARASEEHLRGLEAHVRELEEIRRELEGNLGATRSEASTLAARCAQLERELAMVTQSRSWRITRPLRRVSEMVGAHRRFPSAAPGYQSAGEEIVLPPPVTQGVLLVPDEARLLELANSAAGEPLVARPQPMPIPRGRIEAILSELQALSHPPRTLPPKIDRLPGANVLRTPVLRFYERLFRKQSLINARMTEALRILLENQRDR